MKARRRLHMLRGPGLAKTRLPPRVLFTRCNGSTFWGRPVGSILDYDCTRVLVTPAPLQESAHAP